MKKQHQKEHLLHARHCHSVTPLVSGNLIRLSSYCVTDQGTQAQGPLSREALSFIPGLYIGRLGRPLAYRAPGASSDFCALKAGKGNQIGRESWAEVTLADT